MRPLGAAMFVACLLLTACSSATSNRIVKPVRRGDTSCRSSEREHFYAENATYIDGHGVTWPRADPHEEGIDAGMLQQATSEIEKSHSILSFLVVRNGKLVWERYFNGSGPTHAENIHSASKAILSLLVGQALADGTFHNVDSPISMILPPKLAPSHVRDITVGDLLTMSGGLQWEENVTENEIEHQPSYVRAILDRDRVATPGKTFHYSTGLTQVLSAVLTEATNQTTCEFAKERLLGPLDITSDHWAVDPDGYYAGGHSVFMTPRELARLGQLVVQHGAWNGKQIVSRDWLRRSLAQKWDLGCDAPGERRSYGYLWWLGEVDGVSYLNAQGYGGQNIFVVPSERLVVVTTSDTFARPETLDVVPARELLTNYVIPAVTGHRLASSGPNNCHVWDLYSAPVDRSKKATRLVYDLSLDLWGSPSPDGKRIAFQTRRHLSFDIYLSDAHGGNQQRLTQSRGNESFPAWSPDGTKILFASDEPGRAGLYTMGSDGTHRRHLTDGRDSTPAWSRDGRRIVFSRAVGANKDELWLMNADGTGAHRLAGGLGGVSPDFSPDGRRIVFYSRESGAEVIYEIDANGGEPARITDGRDPRWLLDSSLVLSVRGGLNNTWRIVRLDHGRLRTIVDTEGDELIPIPSFDGRWITFASASPDAPGGTHAKANG